MGGYRVMGGWGGSAPNSSAATQRAQASAPAGTRVCKKPPRRVCVCVCVRVRPPPAPLGGHRSSPAARGRRWPGGPAGSAPTACLGRLCAAFPEPWAVRREVEGGRGRRVKPPPSPGWASSEQRGGLLGTGAIGTRLQSGVVVLRGRSARVCDTRLQQLHLPEELLPLAFLAGKHISCLPRRWIDVQVPVLPLLMGWCDEAPVWSFFRFLL